MIPPLDRQRRHPAAPRLAILEYMVTWPITLPCPAAPNLSKLPHPGPSNTTIGVVEGTENRRTPRNAGLDAFFPHG